MSLRSVSCAVLFALAPAGVLRADGIVAPTGDALQRPAILVPRASSEAVLLAATQAGSRLVVAGERGIVLLSDDGGAHWRQAQVPVSTTITALRFVDAKHGWAAGHGGVVLATQDGGETWGRQLEGKTAAALVQMAARERGDASALKDAERLVADGADKPFLDLHFFDTQRGIVVGAYNLAFETSDGGKSWQYSGYLLDNPKSLHLYAVRASGDKVLIVGEQGLVLLSADGARSFKRVATPYKGTFFSAELLGNQGIVVAGLRGNILLSSDGGAGWTAIPSPPPVSFTASAGMGDGGMLLGNQAGRLFALKNGALHPLAGPSLPPVGALLPLPDGRVLAATLHGLFILPATGEAK